MKTFAFAVLGLVSVSSFGFAATAPVAAPAAATPAATTPAPAAAVCPTDNTKFASALQTLKDAAAADLAANAKLTEARKAFAEAAALERSDNKAEQRVRNLRRAHMATTYAAVQTSSKFAGALASAQAQLDLLKKSGTVLSKEDLDDAREERNELYRVVRILNTTKSRATLIESILTKQGCTTFKAFDKSVDFDYTTRDKDTKLTKLEGASAVISGIDEQLKALAPKATPVVAPVAPPAVAAAAAPAAVH